MKRQLLTLACFALALGGSAEAKQHRSHQVLREFQIAHPCPSTDRRYGPCPGYQKDHIQALCAGGADSVQNLHWLTVEDHANKTKMDTAICRGLQSRHE